MEETNKQIIKYSSYTPAQKRATQKYRENNKDKVNEQRKKYYQNRKERDPQFLEYKRAKAKEYYQLKKQLKVKPDTEPVDKPEPVDISDVMQKIVDEARQPKIAEIEMITIIDTPEPPAPLITDKPIGKIKKYLPKK